MKKDWMNQDGDCTRKTPTSLLLKPDLSFDSFGYAAEEKYSNLRSVFEEKEYWFFQHFKMCLHNDEVRAYEITTPLKTERTTPKTKTTDIRNYRVGNVCLTDSTMTCYQAIHFQR